MFQSISFVFLGLFLCATQVAGHAQLKSPSPRAGYGAATVAGITQFALPVDMANVVKVCAIDTTTKAAQGTTFGEWTVDTEAKVTWEVAESHGDVPLPNVTAQVWTASGEWSETLFTGKTVTPAEQAVTPKVACDKCTLTWLWERAATTEPAEAGGYYTNCADVTIKAASTDSKAAAGSDSSAASGSGTKAPKSSATMTSAMTATFLLATLVNMLFL